MRLAYTLCTNYVKRICTNIYIKCYLDSSSKSRVYQVPIPNSYICVGDDGGMCYWRWDFRVTIV